MKKAPFDAERFIRDCDHFLIPDTIPKDEKVVFSHARGSELYRAGGLDGEPDLDFSSQVGIANIGHNHPLFVEAWYQYMLAIRNAIRHNKPGLLWAWIASDFRFCFELEVEGETLEISQRALASMLARHAFGPDTKFIKGLSGADAVSDAIKFVQKLTHKPYGIAFYDAFHGRLGPAHDATMSKSIQREGFIMPGITHHLVYPQTKEDLKYDMQILHHLPLSDYGFALYEVVQGEGGITVGNYYTWQLLEYLREKGLLLICDEVQTGFGRTGRWFAHEHFGATPDIVAISKSMGSGDPIGAVFFDGANHRLQGWEEFEPGWDSSTFQWNPHAVLSAIITVRILEKEKLVERAAVMGDLLESAILRAIAKNFPDGDPPVGGYCFQKGLGLHQGIEFRKKLHDGSDIPDPETRDIMLARLRENHIYTLGAGHRDINPTIRLMPPLVITEAQITEKFAPALEQALKHERHSAK